MSVAGHRSRWRLIAAAAVSVLVTLIAFAPLTHHPNSTVLLSLGDESSSARNYWMTDHVGKTPFTLTRDPYLDAPEGQTAAPAVQIANALQPAFVLSVHGLAGWLGAFNMFILVGTAASLFAMFALLDSIGLHPLASAAGAVAFGWSQWAIEQLLYGHVAFAQLWVFPLLLGALLWARRGSPARAAAPGLVYALSFYAFSYLGLFASLLTAVYLGLIVVARRSRPSRDELERLGIGVAVAFVALLPVALASRIAPSSNLGLPSGSPFLDGAPFHDYFIPSNHHIVYGGLGKRLFGTHVGETVIFFGYALLVLAAIGAVSTIRHWRTASLVARFATVLVPIGLWASLPAHLPILGYGIPFPDPAFLIGGVVQWWRIYTRFAVLVGFGLAILGAITLDRVIRRRGLLLGVVLASLVLVEAIPGAPLPSVRTRTDAATAWLASHPGGIVAFYPLLSAEAPHGGTTQAWDSYVWGTLYQQVNYHHPLFALPRIESIPSRVTQVRLLASDLENPRTAAILAAERVRWIVVRDDVFRELRLPVPRPGSGFTPVTRVGNARIFRVTAAPVNLDAELAGRQEELARRFAFSSAAVTFGRGFYRAEDFKGYHARWMSQAGEIHLRPVAPKPFVVYRLTIRCFSNAVLRTLFLQLGDRQIASFSVPAHEVSVTTSLRLPAADNVVTLHVVPGPAPLGPSDPRSASIFVEQVTADPVSLDTQTR